MCCSWLLQAEYINEGIDWRYIEFVDNQDVLDLIEGRLGLMDLLDEQCRFPTVSCRCGGYQGVGRQLSHQRQLHLPLLDQNTYQVHADSVQLVDSQLCSQALSKSTAGRCSMLIRKGAKTGSGHAK